MIQFVRKVPSKIDKPIDFSKTQRVCLGRDSFSCADELGIVKGIAFTYLTQS